MRCLINHNLLDLIMNCNSLVQKLLIQDYWLQSIPNHVLITYENQNPIHIILQLLLMRNYDLHLNKFFGFFFLQKFEFFLDLKFLFMEKVLLKIFQLDWYQFNLKYHHPWNRLNHLLSTLPNVHFQTVYQKVQKQLEFFSNLFYLQTKNHLL